VTILAAVGSTFVIVPAQAAPTVYLDESFSNDPSTLADAWYDADIGGRNRISSISDGSDGQAIKVSIPAGSHFGSAMHWQFKDQGIPDPEEVYFRYYLRIPNGFTNYDRGKLPGPAGLYSGSARNNIPPTNSSPGWSARMFFSPTYDDRNNDHTQLGFYVYHRNQAADNGDLIEWDTQTGTLRHGAWYCVEGHVDMNTPGQADGLLEGWVDEKLAFYQDDFVFRGANDGGVNVKSLWFDVYFGGTETAPGSLSFDFDSLVLSSERIGCGDTPVGGFRDIGGSIHEPNIEKLAFSEITKGCNPPLNDLYCPVDSVTRGQMAAFLVRALDLPESSSDYFTDDDADVFEANINALAASGITKGCDTDSFCSTDYVTRGQMAAFLDRALGLPQAPPDRFTDDDNSIFEAAIDRLAESGITAGCNPPANTNFCPHDRVTRAQMASFLSRALELPVPPESDPGYAPPPVPDGFDAVVPVGWSIQEVVDSQPTGARIYIEAGTHLRQTVVPKSNQEFVGEAGAVMDGLGEYTRAFSGAATGVEISGLEIKNYIGSTYAGAIAAGSNWTITDSDVHHTQYVGISIKDGSTVSGSYVHHNGTHGIYVDGGSGAVLENNEIAYNNYDSSVGEYIAGAKIVGTQSLVADGNFVHHNSGYGFWTYDGSTGTVYQDNTIEDNYWAGISHDQSYAVTIDSNKLLRNGSKAPVDTDGARKFYNGAIQIAGPDATVTNNTITDNHNAVVVIGYTVNVDRAVITGNTITNSGNTGVVADDSSPNATSTATINSNSYVYNDTSGTYWVWNTGSTYTWDAWRGFGNDTNGSLTKP
jgi:hypothetical protein